MATVIAGICRRHGFWRGERCRVCAEDKPKQTLNIDIFKPMVYRDIDINPILIESKRQLREECKKRNLVAVRLL